MKVHVTAVLSPGNSTECPNQPPPVTVQCAGGTACPVYRTFFHDRHPRNSVLQTATLEQEFAYDWHDPVCHLWFPGGGTRALPLPYSHHLDRY